MLAKLQDNQLIVPTNTIYFDKTITDTYIEYVTTYDEEGVATTTEVPHTSTRTVNMKCVNPTEEMLKENGYKEVVNNTVDEKEGFYVDFANYTEDAEHIYVNYEYKEKEVVNEEMPTEVDNHYTVEPITYDTGTQIVNGYKFVAKERVEDEKPTITEFQYLTSTEEITDTQVLVHWTVNEKDTAWKVNYLEAKYGMNRLMRELILASGSEYNKAKAQEIEDLAEQLRGE